MGDLPVALGVGEMVRQLRALQLAVTSNAMVDNKGRKIGDCPAKPTGEEVEGRGILDTAASYYNTKILGLASDPEACKLLQSPVDLVEPVPDPGLGPITFHYTAVWAKDPEPWSPGCLASTLISPQPTVVTNTGLSWQVEVAPHYQLTVTHGPFHAR